LEAQAMQRQIVGINYQLEAIQNHQRKMGISTENNTQRIEEVVEKLSLLQARLDKLELCPAVLDLYLFVSSC
jgi:ABC-type phosphate transport system auxiliary subunit